MTFSEIIFLQFIILLLPSTPFPASMILIYGSTSFIPLFNFSTVVFFFESFDFNGRFFKKCKPRISLRNGLSPPVSIRSFILYCSRIKDQRIIYQGSTVTDLLEFANFGVEPLKMSIHYILTSPKLPIRLTAFYFSKNSATVLSWLPAYT